MTDSKETAGVGPTRIQADSRQISTRLPIEATGNQNTKPDNVMISHVNKETYKDNSGAIIGTCDICTRHSDEISIKQYEFGQDKEIISIEKDKVVVTPNPNHFSIVICSSCRKIVTRLKKENPNKSSRILYELSRQYREIKPVQEK